MYQIARQSIALAALVLLSAIQTTVAGPIEVGYSSAFSAWGSIATPFILTDYSQEFGPLSGSLSTTASLNALVDGPSYGPFTSSSVSIVQAYAYGLTGSMQATWDASATRNQGQGDRAHGSGYVGFTTTATSRLYYHYKANDDVFDVHILRGGVPQTTLHATAGRDATQSGSASGSILLTPGTYEFGFTGIAYPGGNTSPTNGFLSYVIDAVNPNVPLGSTATNPVPSVPIDEEAGGKVSMPPESELDDEIGEGSINAENVTGAYLTSATNPGIIDPLYIGGAVHDPGTPAIVADSYLYEITHDSFASVLLPDSIMGLSSFGIRYGLDRDSLTHQGVLTAGTPFLFSGLGDIRAFELYGFESLGFDASRPMPFVLGLKFTEAGGYVVYESARAGVSAVPEPSSLVLIGIGSCLAGAVRLKRRGRTMNART